MRLIAPLLAVVLAGAACRNSCQQVCVEMRAYAEDTCGLAVPDEQFDQCLADQRGKNSRGSRDVCREFGDAEDIALEWTCEDVQEYFGGSAE